MERKMTSLLKLWKEKEGRYPLLVNGVRQAGKTFLIKEFGSAEYKNAIYINFEIDKRVASLFEDLSPGRLIPLIGGMFGQKIEPHNTLLIFDEIQSCERALTSLKYFCEDAPDIHVIAAGSLLGIALNREEYSFPVGKVESLPLYPLDFEEFLWALGKETLGNEIRACYGENRMMPEGLHNELLELYRIYLITGGMPRAIDSWLKRKDFSEVVTLQQEIMNNYIADMAKYAPPLESVKIRACYDSIPVQLAKENKKFQYKIVKSGKTSTYFGVAIEWLNFAGVALKCKKVANPETPLGMYVDLGSFKLYMSDTGLLVNKSGLKPGDILAPRTTDTGFMGAIAENHVAASLAASGYPLYYWQSDNTAEVDFLLQTDCGVIPVEVKAGIHTKSRSLSVFIEKYKPEYAIRISAKNFGFEGGIKSIPLYAAFCL